MAHRDPTTHPSEISGGTRQQSPFARSDAPKDNIDALVDLLVAKKDHQGSSYIKKYNRKWLLQVVNGEVLQLLEKKFEVHEKRGLDVVDFVKILLGVLENTEEETIYIVLEIIEFFKGVCETYGLKDVIRFKDFTSFILEVYSLPNRVAAGREQRREVHSPAKAAPRPKSFQRDGGEADPAG